MTCLFILNPSCYILKIAKEEKMRITCCFNAFEMKCIEFLS